MDSHTRTASTDFLGWLWVPDARVRARGFATVRVAVSPQRLAITPRLASDALNFALRIPPLTEYAWPAVVIEKLRPTGQVITLVEVDGKLGGVATGRVSQRRFVEALRSAGFKVIESTRWGWERPRPVPTADLGSHVDQLPSCVTTA
jgi:hypothetical protein